MVGGTNRMNEPDAAIAIRVAPDHHDQITITITAGGDKRNKKKKSPPLSAEDQRVAVIYLTHTRA